MHKIEKGQFMRLLLGMVVIGGLLIVAGCGVSDIKAQVERSKQLIDKGSYSEVKEILKPLLTESNAPNEVIELYDQASLAEELKADMQSKDSTKIKAIIEKLEKYSTLPMSIKNDIKKSIESMAVEQKSEVSGDDNLEISSAGKSYTPTISEKNKIDIFLSNFTEVGLRDIDRDTISNEDLIHFAVWHNYINNFQSRIESSGDFYYIKKAYVEETIKKYFGISFNNNQSIESYSFDGNGYEFDGAAGEAVYYANCDSFDDLGNGLLKISRNIYNTDDPSDIECGFTAKIHRDMSQKNPYTLENMITE